MVGGVACQPMNSLIVQLGFIGDVVLSTPVITRLKQLYPDDKLYFLTTPQARSLLLNDPRLEEVLVYDKRGQDKGLYGMFEMAGRLRAMEIDRVFSLHKSWRTSFMLYTSGIRLRAGFRESSAWFLYNKRARRRDLPHEVERNRAILRTVGDDPVGEQLPLSIHFSSENQRVAQEVLSLLGDKPLVGLAPGSAWLTKRWNKRGFQEVAARLVERGYGVVIFGSDKEVTLAEEISSYASRRCSPDNAGSPDHLSVLNLAGKISLIEAACVISRLKFLVSNDSSPVHLASAVGTAVVVIFCATVEQFGFGPWMVDHEVAGLDQLSCRPCGRHGGAVCPTGTYACVRDLSVDMVWESIERLESRLVSRSAISC